jgi:hypothetical protein
MASGFSGRRIGAQELQVRRAPAKLGERRCDRCVVAVAGEVDEEQVFPATGARRPRLDARHRHAVPGEGLQQRVHRAGMVGCRHDQRGLVVSGRADLLAPEHPEARPVVGFVLDVGGEHRDGVGRCGDLAGDGGGLRLGDGEPRSLGVARDDDAGHGRQVPREPTDALRERLGVRVDPLHRRQVRSAREQVLLDAQLHLAHHRQVGRAHQVERAAHGALSRVFDWDDREVAATRLRGAEGLVDRAFGHRLDECAEMPGDRGVRERARRTEIGDRKATLEREAGRHDLAEDPGHGLVGKRT